MRFHRIILSFLFIIMCSLLRAQSLSVESFRLLENDLTANTYGTMERDQNGEVAALIRVVTSETGFAFDAGMLGVVKTTQKTGEIWVYVPFGLQRITIFHQELGVVRDYYFPVPIEKARTYEMVLKTERKPDPNQNTTAFVNVMVTLNNPMKEASLYVDDNYFGSGSFKVRMQANREYKVEVKRDGYKTYETTVTVKPDEDGKTITLPELERITGTVVITSQPSGATLYIGGLKKGVTPYTLEKTNLGLKLISIRKRGYYDFDTTVKVTDEDIYNVDAVMEEIMYLKSGKVYLGGVYQMGHLSGVSGYVGLYISDINIEGSYLFPFIDPVGVNWITSPDTWTGNMNRLRYDYVPKQAIGGSLGYGLHYGKRLRMTPQVGAMFYSIEGILLPDQSDPGNYTIQESDMRVSTWVMSLRGAARIELCPFNHLSIAVTPSYEKPFLMGDHAEQMNETSNLIKQWCGGFSIRAGLELYF